MAKKKVKKKPTRAAAPRKAARKPAATTKKGTPKKKASTKTVRKKAPKPEAAAAAAPAPPARRRAAQPALTPAQRLNQIDTELIKLIEERVSTFRNLVMENEHPQKAVFDPQWEYDVWERIDSKSNGTLTSSELRSAFRPILSAGRQRVRSTRVAYLGPAFSFTHLAALQRFGDSADLIPVSTIAAVFEEVNRGHVDFGLVPIENSTDGRIVDTLDMFTRLPLRICGEVQIQIHHHLLARCERNEITEIYSKPQALSQCRDWLSKNMPQARLIEVTSTSTAARLAKEKPGAAAVASQQAAVQYDLNVIADSIEDNRNNVTRFAVIGDHTATPTGRDRTAVLLQISHKPGTLSDALVAFKKNKVNLTWIESFPLRSPEVGYLFFLDFEGHVEEPKIKRTLAELEKHAVRLEILGAYPRSEAAQ